MDKDIIKVLLVEDDVVDARLVERILAKSSKPVKFAVESVGSLSAAIDCLSSKKYDVVLLDLGLPDSSGIETVQKVCEATDIPVVVLTAIGDEEMGLSAIRGGASDYLVKDLPLNILLVRTIIYALERKKAEEQIAKLAKLPQENSSPVYRVSKDGVLLYANPASRKQILEDQTKIGDKIPEKWFGMIKNIYNSGKRQQVEVQINGTTLLLHQVPIIEGGYVNSYAIDITKRKKVEEEVKALNQQLEFILGATKTGLDIIDSEFNIRYINPEWKKVYGDPAGKKCYEYFMDRNEVCPGCGIPKALETKTITVTEKVLVKENNRPTQVTTIPFQNKEGEWLVAEANVDISESKKKEKLILETNRQLQDTSQKLLIARQELEERNRSLEKAREELEKRVEQRTAELAKANKTLQVADENLRKMIMQNADGIVIVDGNGIARFANPAANSLFNRKPEELIGEVFGFSVITGQPTEIEIFRRNEKQITAEMNVAEIDWEGESANLVSIRDITERKLAEETLKKANEKLTEYNQLKDEFVSTASHELRTPLSIIMGAIRLILDEIPGTIVDEQRDVLNTATESVNRLTKIVDSLLTISRIESGRLDLQKTVVNICELIKDTVSNCKPLAQEKNLSLDFEVPEEGIDIYLDPDKTRQALVNLISNSLKFTPEGGWIKVTCSKLDEEVRFSVQDSGVGVAKDDMPRLFDKFTQFGRKAGPGEKGTGLGLAIVKKLVDMHNGRIEVESELNKGTTFTISLPLTTEAPAKDLPAETDELVETTLTNN